MNFVSSSTQYAILNLFSLEDVGLEIEDYDSKAIDLVMSIYSFDEGEIKALLRVKDQLREGVLIVQALADCPIFDAPVRLLLSSTKIGAHGGDALDSAMNYLKRFGKD